MLIYDVLPPEKGRVRLPEREEGILELMQMLGERDRLRVYSRDLGVRVMGELLAFTPIDPVTEGTGKVLEIADGIWRGHEVLSHVPANCGFVQGVGEAHGRYIQVLDQLGVAV